MKNSRPGFDRLEMMMIITAIIGILVAIVAPKISDILNKSKKDRFQTSSKDFSIKHDAQPQEVQKQATPPATTLPEFVLANGQKLTCEKGERATCGVMLYNCSDGFSYNCLQGVAETNEQYKAGL